MFAKNPRRTGGWKTKQGVAGGRLRHIFLERKLHDMINCVVFPRESLRLVARHCGSSAPTAAPCQKVLGNCEKHG
jgi:hypothetical protein